MIIDHVWHLAGEAMVPLELRETPLKLSEADLAALIERFAVMLYQDPVGEVVLALDTPRGRFRQR